VYEAASLGARAAGFGPDRADRRLRAPPRAASRAVPFEQIRQSAVKRLWRQKSEFTGRPRVAAPPWEDGHVATAIVSDLHLGARAGNDLLSCPPIRERLFAALGEVDRVVLLGDVVELRDGPLAPALEAARPFFDELRKAVGDTEVVVVPGNHDHQLAAGALDARRAAEPGEPLPLDWSTREPPAPLAELGPDLVLAYPGVRVRDDVYVTHGHYLDWPNTVPSFESLAASATARLAGLSGRDGLTPDDYESAVAPIYALIYQLAQTSSAVRATGVGRASMGIWRTLNGGGGLRARLLGGVAIPVAVALLNRIGLGPLEAEISGPELRRASLRAIGGVVASLEIEAEHVVFGHTHRAGPLPADNPDEWSAPTGAGLWNSGSWVYEPDFLAASAADSPHWPGGLVLVPDDGPPELLRLLDDLGHRELCALLDAGIKHPTA
jgi:predicted phosphodiesterase